MRADTTIITQNTWTKWNEKKECESPVFTSDLLFLLLHVTDVFRSEWTVFRNRLKHAIDL